MSNENLSNVHIVVYALYLCGGRDKKIHTEHIAKRCYELAPDRFSWRLYQYPDKEPVRIALHDAMKEEKGALVEGRAGMEAKGKELDGWTLTSAGIKWLKSHEQEIRSLLKEPKKRANKTERDKFEKRIAETAAYGKFSANKNTSDIKDFEFTEMLRCSPDASADIMQKKFDALLRKAQDVESNEISFFLESCAEKFKHLLCRNWV
jgi:hypothetical protein